MTGTLSTPGVGSPNSTEDPKIATAVTTVNGLLTASNLLDGAQIGAGTIPSSKLDATGVLDTDIASPNNSVYKTLMVGHTAIANSLAAGTYALSGQEVTLNAGAGTFAPLASGGNLARQTGSSTGDISATPSFIYFDDADFTVGSLTQKLRVRAQVSCNTVSWSSVTATFGLYPVTFAGGNNTLTVTLGTVVPGSTAAIANPTASTTSQNNSGDFTIPSDGQFCLGVVTNASLTGNAASLLTAQLQTRNV